jgi:(R)-2-hydroxyacyl-CoA dehydratese activating ATPase
MMNVAGVDAGSATTKIVIISNSNELFTHVLCNSGPDLETTAWKLLGEALEKAGIGREDLKYTVSTGVNSQIVPFSDNCYTDITCNALGIWHLFPSVRTIIDVGVQESKAIMINEKGSVKKFVMNERCAAGAGRFTEVISQALEIPLTQWDNMVEFAPQRARISSKCTVFAESEAISMLSQKIPVSEIVAGICEAIAIRIYQMVLRLGNVEKEVCFTGGVALNIAVASMIEEKLDLKLIIPKVPQITAALGAALLAREHVLGKHGEAN